MFEFFERLFRWFMDLWEKLPEPLKAAIIAVAVEAFDAVFRAYYQSHKDEGDKAHA